MVKKDAISNFWKILGPRTVALVTSISIDGKPNIITVAWVTPLSIRPPLLGVVIGKPRYSYKLIEDTGEFVVNIPSNDLVKQVNYCGSVSGRDVNKFEKAGLTPKPAKMVKPPIIEECIAHIECRTVNKISVGDHSLFVGTVLAAYADDRFFTTSWDITKVKLLMHLGEATYTTPSNSIAV